MLAVELEPHTSRTLSVHPTGEEIRCQKYCKPGAVLHRGMISTFVIANLSPSSNSNSKNYEQYGK